MTDPSDPDPVVEHEQPTERAFTDIEQLIGHDVNPRLTFDLLTTGLDVSGERTPPRKGRGSTVEGEPSQSPTPADDKPRLCLELVDSITGLDLDEVQRRIRQSQSKPVLPRAVRHGNGQRDPYPVPAGPFGDDLDTGTRPCEHGAATVETGDRIRLCPERQTHPALLEHLQHESAVEQEHPRLETTAILRRAEEGFPRGSRQRGRNRGSGFDEPLEVGPRELDLGIGQIRQHDLLRSAHHRQQKHRSEECGAHIRNLRRSPLRDS